MEAKAEHAGQDVTLAIIAGGGGHRLGGVAKGLLTLEGRPLIERILDLRPRFSEVLLVADNPGAYKAYGLRSVPDLVEGRGAPGGDRKSTRLNSSHPSISYAVFCLKKKNKTIEFMRVRKKKERHQQTQYI